MSEWQPIGTAPRDGTAIDIWRELIQERLPNAYWRDGKWWWRHYRYDEGDDQITHWIKINPPKQT